MPKFMSLFLEDFCSLRISCDPLLASANTQFASLLALQLPYNTVNENFNYYNWQTADQQILYLVDHCLPSLH